MGWLAKAICSAVVYASVAEDDDLALLQAQRIDVHANTKALELPGDHCVVAGDPHIKPFDMDGAEELCLGPMGDYIIMQNDKLFVHGRYRGFERDSGYAFVQGLVIGGPAMGGKLVIPTTNNGCLKYKGDCLAKQFGKNEFDLGNDVTLTVRKARGPDLVNFRGADSMGDTSIVLTYFIELKKQGVLDFLVMVNQGLMQHVVISGTTGPEGILAGTTGQCGNDNGDPSDDHMNVDACPGKLPCDKGHFDVVNPECDKPREPEECKDDSEKVAFFKEICEGHFASDAYATTHYQKKGDKAKEWQVWNCITDCCADRDTCPDLNNEGEWADCLVKGDPHIKTWDSGVLNKNVFGPLDDYTLVQNDYITVQGRYGSDRSDNKASLQAVAVAGLLTGGKTIVIPKGYEHPVTVDGEEMVGERFDKYDKAFKIRYEAKGVNLNFLFDKTKNSKKKEEQHLKPLYVIVLMDPVDGTTVGRVRVNRARAVTSTNMAAHITLKSAFLTGVSGQCGNFNGDRHDDFSKEEDIVSTGNGQSLFPDANPQQGSEPYPNTCQDHQVRKAERCCKSKHGEVSPDVIKACATDNCCGEDTPCDPTTQCFAGQN
jgi:hypothetical protein